MLTRQKLGFIDRSVYASAAGVAKGAYVLADADGGAPDVVLMSSGSEVALVLEARTELAKRGVKARVVSVPSMELFRAQPKEYRDAVLPRGVRRLAIEAAHPASWWQLVGDEGEVIGVERYGASAPYARIYEELGLTVKRVVETAATMVGKR